MHPRVPNLAGPLDACAQVQLWRQTRLVPLHLNGEDPSYLIVGGASPPVGHSSACARCQGCARAGMGLHGRPSCSPPLSSCCAGLVFTVACEPYLLDEFGHPADAPVLMQADYLHGQQKQGDHEVGPPLPPR